MHNGKDHPTFVHAQNREASYKHCLGKAREAEQRGDWVAAEGYYQKADHYRRLLKKPVRGPTRPLDHQPYLSQPTTDASPQACRPPHEGRKEKAPSSFGSGGYLRQNRRKLFKDKGNAPQRHPYVKQEAKDDAPSQ